MRPKKKSNNPACSSGSYEYYPFRYCRNSTGNLGTDKLFTGQRLDGTGLYYYNARYYDPTIGRFISADTVVQDYTNPQSFNRYSYCINNPLKYTDPDGHWIQFLIGAAIGAASYTAANALMNAYSHRSEGGFFNALKTHGLEDWRWQDAVQAAAIGAVTGGISASSTLKAAAQYYRFVNVKEIATVTLALAGGTAQFCFDVADRQATASDAYIYFLTSFVKGGTKAQTGDWGELARQGIGGLIDTGTGTLRTLAINTNSIDTSARNAYPLSSPVPLTNDGGISFWGYGSGGIPIYASRDPSTYSDYEWYGY